MGRAHGHGHLALRRIVDGDGSERLQVSTSCPSCRATVPIDLRGVRDLPTLRGVGQGVNALVPVDAPVTAAMSREVVCVREDTSIEALRDLFIDRHISGVPVVDELGHPVGVVSKTDLVRDGALDELGYDHDEDGGALIARSQGVPYRLEPGFHLERVPRATVRDIMTPFSFALPQSATLAEAAALMAYEGVHRLLIVGPDGTVVGLVTALDLVRWIAQHVPAPPAYKQEGRRTRRRFPS